MAIRAVVVDINGNGIYPSPPQYLGIPKPSMAIGTPIQIMI